MIGAWGASDPSSILGSPTKKWCAPWCNPIDLVGATILLMSSLFKKIYRLLLVGVLGMVMLLEIFSPALAQTDTGWVITDFASDITINADTSVQVTEAIHVDFGQLEKHGIYRTIPVKYRDRFGNNLDIRFRLVSVTDETGKRLNVASKTQEGDDLTIKIGDPNVTVSGKQTYKIAYQVNRVLTRPDNSTELYWNVTGNDWPVPIQKAQAIITGPENSVKDGICFADYFGGQKQNCQKATGTETATFQAKNLAPGQGLTVAVALDPTVFRWPGFGQRALWFFQDNWIYGLPFLVFLVMLRLWWTRGRDKQYQDIFHESGDIETIPLFSKFDSLMAFGPPKDLSPGEVGALVDEKVHLQDITAIAIDLARRGFFTIKELPKKGLFGKVDFELKFTKKNESELKDFETEVLDMLFGKNRVSPTKLSKPPKTAYQHLDAVKSKLYEHLTQTGYFAGNPKTVRTVYLVIGAVVAGLGFVVGPILTPVTGMLGSLVAFGASGLIILAFAFFMPARTPKGRKALKEVVGLREWIRLGAWREQIHEKHNFLEEVLPYTIAFGLTYKFIAAFKNADLKQLAWYQSSQPLTITHFSDSFSHFQNNLNQGIASTRPRSASSGGSGFSSGSSGGGFGGGGGGSW